MGMVADRQNNGGNGAGKCSWGFGSLIRRKQVDSVHVRREGHTQLARKLSAVDLIAIGNSIDFFVFPNFELRFEYAQLKFLMFGYVGLFSYVFMFLSCRFFCYEYFFVNGFICFSVMLSVL
jgi:hypothetical protein